MIVKKKTSYTIVKQTSRVSCPPVNETVSEAPDSGRRGSCGAADFFFDFFLDFLSFFWTFCWLPVFFLLQTLWDLVVWHAQRVLSYLFISGTCPKLKLFYTLSSRFCNRIHTRSFRFQILVDTLTLGEKSRLRIRTRKTLTWILCRMSGGRGCFITGTPVLQNRRFPMRTRNARFLFVCYIYTCIFTHICYIYTYMCVRAHTHTHNLSYASLYPRLRFVGVLELK
jgi:hypothetical protein